MDGIAFLRHRNAVHRLLAGRQRAPEVAGRMQAGAAFLALPSPRALRFLWQPLPPGLQRSWCGLENVLRMARRATKGRLACPSRGCWPGDAACLDLDLRSRDAPAPAAPRWRKTHRGRCSAPFSALLAIRYLWLAAEDFLVRLCKTGFKAQPARIDFAGVNISRICIYRRLR